MDKQTVDIQTVQDIQESQATTGATHPSLTTIECVDCGAKRIIAKQEAFQVKRCVACQKLYSKERRKQYRKARIQALKDTIEALNGNIQALKIENAGLKATHSVDAQIA